MATQKPISDEGQVAVGSGGTIYTTPTNSTAEISSIQITNKLASYTIEIRKWINSATSRLIFKYTLDMGDVHTHDKKIRLRAGQYLTAVSDSTSTEFIIEGIEFFEV